MFATLICFASFGQAQILKDLNEDAADNDYTRKFLTSGTSKMYFIYNNALWRSNGATASTVKVQPFESITSLVTLGNTAYFIADDGIHGLELWRSNGTPETTNLVMDIASGPEGSSPGHLIATALGLFFSADDGVHGRELWISLGYQSKTSMVSNVRPRKASSDPTGLTFMDGTVYFSANDGRNGHELWKSDGTAAGTTMVKDLRPGPFLGSTPTHLTAVNGMLYFEALDGVHGRELWKSDGTAVGTSLLKDIRPGSRWADADHLTDVNGTLFFSANDGVHGEELWKSDGSDSGTVLVKDMNPGSAGSNEHHWYGEAMGSFTNINGMLYFTASQGFVHYIYRSDGTEQGTIQLQFAMLIANQTPQPAFTYLDGNVYYFNAITEDEATYRANYALWSMPYDGTEPEMIAEFVGIDSNQDRFYQEMISFSGNLYTFSRFKPEGYAYAGAMDLIRSNGTTAGTRTIKDFGDASHGSYPNAMLRVNDLIYMQVNSVRYPEGELDGALYSTDGTPEGTHRLAEMGWHDEMAAVGDKLFFTGFENYGWAFFVTEGTPETTISLDGSVEGNNPIDLTPLQDKLYYYNWVNYEYAELRRTDGTLEGMELITTFAAVNSIHNVNDIGYVKVVSMNGEPEMWKINSAGELEFVATLPDPGSAYPNESITYPSASIGDVLYFIHNDGFHGFEIWQTDGTAVGTFMMFDLNTMDEPDDSGIENDIRSFTVYNNTLYFSAKDSEGTWSWFYATGDHTYEKITDMLPVNLSVVHNNLMFLFPSTEGPNSVSQFWISNGTSAGTSFIMDLEGSGAVDHAIVNEAVYFNTRTGPHMLRSDGTSCGTFTIEDGVEYAWPLEALDDTMIYGASTPSTGMEPFVYHNIDAVAGPGGCMEVARAGTSLATENEEILMPYPNPFTDSFTMRVKGKDGERASVSIFTVTGMPVEQFDDVNTNEVRSGIGRGWQGGVYVVKVRTRDAVRTYQVLKR